MQVLERVFDLVSVLFGNAGRSFERSITSLFGTSNARYIRKLQPKVEAINALEPKYQAMSDAELRQQTFEFRKRLDAGQTLDELLVEAFAVCREASRRFIGLRHYDVQLMGGMVLHNGCIGEMMTGEGKTLVATLPAYLNALSGKGVHVVTVNPYLARRDMEWMGPVYMGLGLTVGAIYPNQDPSEKQAAYQSDITYGTNNEFGFDYLRDHMKPARRGDPRYDPSQQQAQGRLNFAIIDEVDNILIDEARTPLIISGAAHDDVKRYVRADEIARRLKKDLHFEVKEKEHTVQLTDDGVREAERLAGVESFYTAGNMDWPHLIDNSLKAHFLYKRDVNYVVQNGEVIIVDEFTGRLMQGRQWSDGLHQAVEAKEGVKIKEESQTYATITLQNFFKLYNKICGMTGTAMTEASEFWKIYKLDVVAVPGNKKIQRADNSDVIYRTVKEKYEAIVDEIVRLHRYDTVHLKSGEAHIGTITKEDDSRLVLEIREKKNEEEIKKDQVEKIERKGRPILVGTVSIEKSERLSSMLERMGIRHEVLNAKHHQREAEIISQAGRHNAVTIATNMAGRGTDIILGGNPETMAWAQLQNKYPTRLEVPQDEWIKLVTEIEQRENMKAEGQLVRSLGGLHIIGTERHEARRIDLQLRGRAGRQGDPGSSRFYLSLEDDLMRIFAGEWVKNMLTRLGMQDGEAIESRMVSRRIEGAQKKVEERNFEIRKSLLEYDEVMDEQRKRVYSFRQSILDGVNCKSKIVAMIRTQINRHVAEFMDRDYGAATFANWASNELSCTLEPSDFRGIEFGQAQRTALDEAQRQAETQVVDAIEENLPDDVEESEWNWEALTRAMNTRWKISLGPNDLRKAGRAHAAELLLEKIRAQMEQTDFADGERFLDPEYGLRTTCAWVQYKFGVELPLEEARGKELEPLKAIVLDKAQKAYIDREIHYPVLTGLAHFTQEDSHGTKRVDGTGMAGWAAQRFADEVSAADLESKSSLEDAMPMLIDASRRDHAKVEKSLAEITDYVRRTLDAEAGTARQPVRTETVDKLIGWLQERCHVTASRDMLVDLSRSEFEERFFSQVEDHLRPEMRRMERQVVLQLLDTAWKEHLLAMDHLREAVRMRSVAQVDPKVEYKREGMRIYETMWEAVGERTTDLIFRMENLDEGFVGSTFAQSRAVHESIDSGSVTQGMIAGNAPAGDAPTGEPAEKVEPIRNLSQTVGRNDPCPCGSGKKYKNCCLRKGAAAGD
jgi:preprotein translocase subunit SecA